MHFKLTGQRFPAVLALGLVCGAFLSVAFINPYFGEISLSELVLQLSGARSFIQMGTSLGYLLEYSEKQVPNILFELYIGTNLYRHFCTASVYVFSRTTDRLGWYRRECLSIAALALVFQAALLGSALAVALLRYTVVWDAAGAQVLAAHAALYFLWTFAMTLLTNLLAMAAGSELAFSSVFGGQAVLITLLAFLSLLEENLPLYSLYMNVNPIARLVLGWHTFAIEACEANGGFWQIVYAELSFPVSLCYIALVAVGITAVGAVLVQKHDLLAADAEFGGA